MSTHGPGDWGETRHGRAAFPAAAAAHLSWEAFDALMQLDDRLWRLGVSARERTTLTSRVLRAITVSLLEIRRQSRHGLVEVRGPE